MKFFIVIKTGNGWMLHNNVPLLDTEVLDTICNLTSNYKVFPADKDGNTSLCPVSLKEL